MMKAEDLTVDSLAEFIADHIGSDDSYSAIAALILEHFEVEPKATEEIK